MSSSNKYFSHPGKLLEEHLRNVAETSLVLAKSKKLNFSEIIDNATLEDIVYLIGAAHDFGKFTKYFQEYLFADESEKARLRNKKETNHGFVSAVFTYFLITDYLKSCNIFTNKFHEYLPIIAFEVVKRHHGDLRSILDEIIIDEDDVSIFSKQISNIDFEAVGEIYSGLFDKIKFKPSSFPYLHETEKIERITFPSKRIIRKLDEINSPLFYSLTLFFYSVLLDSDKRDAAELIKQKRIHIQSDVVDKYKAKKFGSGKNEISSIRNSIYDEVIDSVKSIDLDNEKIFSLNVPTGGGKTLTSFSFALKLRERIASEKGYTPRIIYSLPFLSIIEQNFAVINEALENPASDVLLKHHHLSDVLYRTSDNEYNGNAADAGKNLLLIEGWNAEIVFTTFAQFFHSIITNKNRAARKFHNIVNSIVILDEIQAVPHKYWLLLEKLLGFISEKFNVYFLLMTATRPALFENAKELLPNKEKYFEKLNRYKLIIEREAQPLEKFIEETVGEIQANSNADFLIVMNTINSSIEVFEALSQTLSDETELFYLSTNIIPKHRNERIEEIERSDKRKVIVSTQMIEAGVDLDVDIIYRDFAPIDSINQTAGRCNRNFSNELGETRLVNIFQENEETGKIFYPKSIYDVFLLSKTEDTLQSIEIAEEKDFLELTEQYFSKIKNGKSDDESRKILEYVLTLDFDKLSEFKLIEDNYPAIDIFVAATDDAEKVWRRYEEIRNSDELSSLEKRNEFLKIRRAFNDYIISVPRTYAPDFEQDKINYISSDEINAGIYYVCQTGFDRTGNNSGVFNL